MRTPHLDRRARVLESTEVGPPMTTKLIPREETMTATKTPTKTCRAHCRSCDRCFASDDAFDAHRAGRHDAPLGSFEGRRCINPAEDERGRFDFDEGECRTSEEAVRSDRRIWFLAAARARLRKAHQPGYQS